MGRIKVMRPITTREEYMALRDSEQNRRAAKRDMVQMNYSCMPDPSSALKITQEGQTPMCKNVYPLKGQKTPSNTVGMDVDFDPDDADYEKKMAEVPEMIMTKKEELGLLMLERSATKGFHIVFRRHPEMTQEENLKWASKVLGVEYDKGAKDITRVFFTPADKLLYLDDEIFKAPPSLPQGEGLSNDSAGKITQKGLLLSRRQKSPLCKNEATAASLKAFDLCVLKAGLHPERMDVWGVHNWHTNLTAVLSKGLPKLISKEQMMAVAEVRLPNYSQTEDCRVLIDYFYDTYHANVGYMSKDMCEINAVLNNVDGDDAWGVQMMLFNESFLQRMPPLPPAFDACLKGVDPKFHMPILVAILPVFCTYAEKMMYYYSDGRLRRLNLIAFVLGKFASNKGASVTKKIRILLKPMKATDDAAREADDEAREQSLTRKDTERGKVSHQFIRKLNVDTTDAALLRMQKIAARNANVVEGYVLPLKNFMFTEEASCVATAMRNGKMTEAWRLAFDNGEWGKDTASASAQAGIVDLSFDLLAECTPRIFERLIDAGNFENGTASRILLAFTPAEEYAHMPYFTPETDKVRQQMLQGVALCQQARGIIDDKHMQQAFRAWCDQVADECRETKDKVRDDLRKRAAVMGAVCCVLCAIMWDKRKKDGTLRITQNAVDFGLLMAEYAMEGQAMIYSQYYRERSERITYTGARTATKNKVLYDNLGDRFSRSDVKRMKPGTSNAAVTMTIKAFMKQGLIIETAKNEYEKVKKLNC